MLQLIPAFAGAILFWLNIIWWKRILTHPAGCLRRSTGLFFAGLFSLIILFLFASSGIWYWYYHRPLPHEKDTILFQGIEYIRDVRSEPRPLVVHVVIIDLDAPGIRFFVTPGTPDEAYSIPQARTTSQFLDEFNLQLAINGDFFDPWWSNFPDFWNYYPHVGDPANVTGFAASEGVIYAQPAIWTPHIALFISEDNRAFFNGMPAHVYNAISGDLLFLWRGQKNTRWLTREYHTQPNPRTAIGLDKSGRKMILLLVDGRQPNYSEGVTLDELADLMLEYGAYSAINMDGGGSVTLAIEGSNGKAEVLNSPIQARIPGLERPVANHLGIYALPP
ncbi:MAG: phosphodiester glycosidase family protein [Chloroflexi bacterium]|nr:phosphodiester glycosidase family protein [Chloroflexota bacterium]